MNKNNILSILFIAVIIYTGGCLLSSPSYTPVKYYSLQTSPQSLPSDTIIKIKNISTIGVNGTKMVFKTDRCRILVDEYHRWLNTPATMITTALQSSFSSTEEKLRLNAAEYTVTGTIFEFIADVDSKTTILGITYRIKSKTGILLNDAVTFTIPMAKVEPDNYATAMSKAVDKLAERISKAITAIKSKKQK
jgi:uncharacterized lipoprotein YmbA